MSLSNDKRAYEEWQQLCNQIRNQTEPPKKNETAKVKTKRIKDLLNDFEGFCQYYFPHYCKSPFGWFHKEAADKIIKDKKAFAILEWAREHAKSVFADVFMPLYLKAKGELTGMILVSANGDKASGLLGDIQAEFMNNQRYIADFGEQVSYGNWQSNHFATKDGCGFWAFGRGQSPRGARQAAKRPNFAVVDDIDDKVIVKNPGRVREALDWVLEDLLGCLAIEGGRLIVAGNRIHKEGILAHLVGDIEEGDPKRENIIHVKVFAIEKGKKHEKADANEKGAKPAWHENHKLEDLIDRMSKMGFRASRREYFHEHHEEGLIFKDDWIEWVEPLTLKEYDAIVVYCDPSFKDTAKSDYKAVVAVGLKGKYYDVLKCWLRQDTVKNMVATFYEYYDWLEDHARYYMEANMLQDLLIKEFDEEAEERGFHVPLRADKAKKENKEMRIENLSPLFERGYIRFSRAEKGSTDMQNLKLQFLGFGSGMKDDGPDAVEGAIKKLAKKQGKVGGGKHRSGKYNNSKRKY